MHRNWKLSSQQKGALSIELYLAVALIAAGSVYLVLAPLIHQKWLLLLGALIGLVGVWVVKHSFINLLNAGSATEISIVVDEIEIKNRFGYSGTVRFADIDRVVRATVGSSSGRMGWELSVVTREPRVLLITSFRSRDNPIIQEIMAALAECVSVEDYGVQPWEKGWDED